jgi:hypothetical protein
VEGLRSGSTSSSARPSWKSRLHEGRSKCVPLERRDDLFRAFGMFEQAPADDRELITGGTALRQLAADVLFELP